MAEMENCTFHVPSLEEICSVLKSGLLKNFADVSVIVTECPDLSKEPFEFPVKGLCGKSRIADVGGVPYLVPKPRLDKVYNVNAVAKKIGLPGAYILGAGATSHKSLGMNAELIFSVQAENESIQAVNKSYVASVNPGDGSCLLEKYRDRNNDNDFGLLSNLYACEGKPGKVIEVSVKRRIGQDNFVSCMRKSLKTHYGEKAVGLGGTFLLKEGKAKLHVMGYDLRLEHTHCFSHHGEGGHYHYDTTPDTVEYLGYFHPAELLYRIDKPSATHMVGRD
ncbi:ester hydrolase C11orf54 homolog isoform X2 [Xenopus tropicalis]|uniref:Ester hydrolase C11orf54 homolog isoform X2 n=1 Tax=Xenopus tropicalis TaxID=8364 RepID=A0A8J1J1V7_XENTR|nr:ester hydrolase C11orf54 homolog isoform X2 [Xenopus tropicalis]|eukprot:XP_012812415.1 PREDICTED: ester hydrolase C11orf54 homolog isoform X2 [Xenopus tropicalis]